MEKEADFEFMGLGIGEDFDPGFLPEEWVLAGWRVRADGVEEVSDGDTLDSFDWDLWGSGHLLVRADGRVALWSAGEFFCGGEGLASEELPPGFAGSWEELPPGMVRSTIGEEVENRCLLPQFDFERSARRYAVENGEGKVVLRFSICEVRVKEDCVFRALRPWTLTGYGAEAERYERALGLVRLRVADIECGLSDAGIRVRRGSGDGYGLRPGMLVGEAVQRIALTLLRTVEESVDGVVADLDTEFLHDFRVSLRKLRSLMTALKGAFLAGESGPLREALSVVARETNRLRDLDVNLAARAEYEELLPADLRPGLREMFSDLEAVREAEQERISAFLMGGKFRGDLDRIRAFFEKGLRGRMTDVSFDLIADVAAERAWQRFGKLVKSARQMGEESPDEAIHRVRIEAKKLRYVLEFFGSVLPAGRLGRMTKSLRKLQNALGAFNDRSVHRAHLWQYWEGKTDFEDRNLPLAIGGLLTALHARQMDSREGILKSLQQISSDKAVREAREALCPGTNES